MMLMATQVAGGRGVDHACERYLLSASLAPAVHCSSVRILLARMVGCGLVGLAE